MFNKLNLGIKWKERKNNKCNYHHTIKNIIIGHKVKRCGEKKKFKRVHANVCKMIKKNSSLSVKYFF